MICYESLGRLLSICELNYRLYQRSDLHSTFLLECVYLIPTIDLNSSSKLRIIYAWKSYLSGNLWVCKEHIDIDIKVIHIFEPLSVGIQYRQHVMSFEAYVSVILTVTKHKRRVR
jgi:hypothetical protein